MGREGGDRAHRRQSIDPATPLQADEEGLCLIVLMVAEQQVGDAFFCTDLREQAVARLAGAGLQVGGGFFGILPSQRAVADAVCG